ncbi:hypothetical protein J2X36_001409 [Methylobacterium sp. BE186]|uniref:hypothetical protein n=1 Tax=Methylobacterium sp. BE186 TaxID=2817715 RepID=UPI002855B7A5|nr:hypothetical protein [Methylobacterium sp. BE186]MDR7036668.1 hypothetical protein [Methylobacterium sp. BE186]
MVRSIRVLAAALVIGVAAFGAGEASARGFGGGRGFGPHGGFGGFGHHHGGFGHRWGWRTRVVGFVPAYVGACYVKRFIDEDGDMVVRKICD